MLMVVEAFNAASSAAVTYNNFLTGIGSSIQLIGDRSAPVNETIGGQFGDLTVGSSKAFRAELAYVTSEGNTVVATESFAPVVLNHLQLNLIRPLRSMTCG